MDESPDQLIKPMPGGYFSLLPKEVVAYMMFEYLNFYNIRKCYLTDRVFHCLGGHQLEMIKKVSKGYLQNIQEGSIDVCQWIYNSKKKGKKKKFIMHGFKTACQFGQLSICQWLYDLSIKKKIPIKLSNQLLKNSTTNTDVETIEWSYELVTGIGKSVNIIQDIFIPS